MSVHKSRKQRTGDVWERYYLGKKQTDRRSAEDLQNSPSNYTVHVNMFPSRFPATELRFQHRRRGIAEAREERNREMESEMRELPSLRREGGRRRRRRGVATGRQVAKRNTNNRNPNTGTKGRASWWTKFTVIEVQGPWKWELRGSFGGDRRNEPRKNRET